MRPSSLAVVYFIDVKEGLGLRRVRQAEHRTFAKAGTKTRLNSNLWGAVCKISISDRFSTKSAISAHI